MAKKQNFLVIGLGRFGTNVAKVFHENGHDVLGIDNNMEAVQRAIDAKMIDNAMQVDAKDSISLKKVEIDKFAAVIVGIGSSIEDSVLITANLRELNVKKIIAKASTEIHGKILEKLGVDKVVYPEAEMGRSLAKQVLGLNQLDEFALSENISIAEISLPKVFHGKSLAETNIRSDYNLNILAIRRAEGSFSVTLTPQTSLHDDDYLLVIGTHDDIENFQSLNQEANA